MEVKLINKTGKITATEIESKLWDIVENPTTLAKYVRVYLANQRMSNAHSKDKGEVSGGGRKPWRQKGTGRARHGSSRSPIWTKGGVTFGPTNAKNAKLTMNKKESVVAFVSAVKEMNANENLYIVELPDLTKTKDAVDFLEGLGLGKKVTVVSTDSNSGKAIANIGNLKLKTNKDLSVYDIITAGKIAFTKEALAEMVETKERVYFK